VIKIAINCEQTWLRLKTQKKDTEKKVQSADNGRGLDLDTE